MTDPAVYPAKAHEAFQCIKRARESGRRIVPLFGSGVSADAGIPTSAILADYIVAVCALASGKGWQDYAAYLRKYGWPHRHDVWSDWLVTQSATDYTVLNAHFDDIRHNLYCHSMADEIRSASPLYARMAKKHFEALGKSEPTVTDYRSLLATITRNDGTLIDAFFDHFTRDRRPSTIHQFIAFIAQLLRVDLFLTTNP